MWNAWPWFGSYKRSRFTNCTWYWGEDGTTCDLIKKLNLNWIYFFTCSNVFSSCFRSASLAAAWRCAGVWVSSELRLLACNVIGINTFNRHNIMSRIKKNRKKYYYTCNDKNSNIFIVRRLANKHYFLLVPFKRVPFEILNILRNHKTCFFLFLKKIHRIKWRVMFF